MTTSCFIYSFTGPTGCGKTEIARRLAKITDSPFVKVEATKFTEVGFHGRDVDQIIKDLVDNAMHLTKTKLRARFADEVNEVVENKIVDFMCGETSGDVTRDAFLQMYRDGALDHRVIELELPEGGGEGKGMELGGGGAMTPERVVIQLEKVRLFLVIFGYFWLFLVIFGNLRMGKYTDVVFLCLQLIPGGRVGGRGSRMTKKRMTVRECRPLIEEMEYERLINSDVVVKEALKAVENDGIVFLDEIDKVSFISLFSYLYGQLD